MDERRYERRQQEFEEAESPLEVDRLFARWHAEDIADARAKTVERQRLDAMARRLHQLERTVAAMPSAVGTVIGKALKDRPGMQYGGVHDVEQSYRQNTLVTSGGSLWLALTEVEKGMRPGKSPAWRLIAKAGSAPAGVFA